MEPSRTQPTLRPVLVFCISIALIIAVTGGFNYIQPKSLPSALELHVSVDTKMVVKGQSVAVDIWENNTLPEKNNVAVATNWGIADLTVYSCVRGWPIGMELLKGYYVTSNVSQGTLVFYPFISSCPAALIILQSLTFLPDSSMVVATTNFGTPTWDIRQTFTYQNLNSGEYTVVVYDEWGHQALAQFTVTAGP